MNSRKNCPQCGAPLAEDREDQPCPACLMQLGLKSWQDGQGRSIPATQMHRPPDAGDDLQELATLFPQLEIIQLLGRGGMGSVYKARQKTLDRVVALKIIKQDAAADSKFAERFVREARALAHLSHPNIVTVHDFGQAGKLYYFIMEFVDGINLRQMLEEGRLESREALEIVPHICDALQYAHDEGIVHRDIKPENILVDRSGRVKIADFGLAKLLNRDTALPALTGTHHVMGTMHYMAPEQIEKPLSVDHRADIYSLGVVIYEMLTGELPLGRFAPPSKKVQVDVRLDEVVLHTLEKEPAHRYQKVSEIKTDINSISRIAAGSAAPPVVMQAPRATDWASPQAIAKPVAEAAKVAKKDAPAPPPRYDLSQLSWKDVSPGGFFGVALQPRTWLNIAYLLLSFPLGIVYFVVLITGLSLGLGLLVIWIGVLILLGVLLLARGVVVYERAMSNALLGTQIAGRDPSEAGGGVWRQLKRLFADRVTWTGMGFMLLKFPLGIASFVLVVSLLSVGLSLTAQIVTYQLPFNNATLGPINIDTWPEAVATSVFGLFFLVISLHTLNAWAWLNGLIARICLGR